MIEWLQANMEWLFSGVGAMVLFAAAGWLFRDRKVTADSDVVAEFEESGIPVESAIVQSVETTGRRIATVIELMNRGRHCEVFSYADISRILGLSSTGELEEIIADGQNVPHEFVDIFCQNFGANDEWLESGRSNPFYHIRSTSDPLWHLDEIRQSDAKGICFVRERSDDSRVVIVLKLAEDAQGNGWKFRILNAPWNISGHVGAGGQLQIYSFYRLILALKEHGLYMHCHGREIDADLFSLLNAGKIFPGQVIDGLPGERHWWDDFTDVNGRYVIAENYKAWYGAWFEDAQAIVRWKLEEQSVRLDSRIALAASRIHGIERIILFGSRATGDADVTSDIDLAVICDDVDASAWKYLAESLDFGVKLDLHRWDDMSDAFRQRVEETGKVIYERQES